MCVVVTVLRTIARVSTHMCGDCHVVRRCVFNVCAGHRSAGPATCHGAPNEMACEGGELQFVRKMIEDSAVLRGRITWYTTMLGKQRSVRPLKVRLFTRRRVAHDGFRLAPATVACYFDRHVVHSTRRCH